MNSCLAPNHLTFTLKPLDVCVLLVLKKRVGTNFSQEPFLVFSLDIVLVKRPIRYLTCLPKRSLFLEMLSFMRTFSRFIYHLGIIFLLVLLFLFLFLIIQIFLLLLLFMIILFHICKFSTKSLFKFPTKKKVSKNYKTTKILTGLCLPHYYS